MSEEQQESTLARFWPLALGLGLVAVWALWPRDATESKHVSEGAAAATVQRADTTSPRRLEDAPTPEAARAPVGPAPRTPSVHSETSAAPAPVPAYQEPLYELPIVGPGPDDPHDEAMHPHPITAEHVRIQKVNGLIQNLNDAMSNRDVKAMRSLVEEFKRADPADEDNFQLGYSVIADCIESPGRASLAAAHDFYDTYRASTLRRFVRRLCFEAGS